MAHALLDAREQVVVLDNLTTGFDWAEPSGARLIVGDVGDQLRVGALIAAHRIDAKAVVKAGVRYFIFSSTAAHRRTQDVGREKILSRQSAGED